MKGANEVAGYCPSCYELSLLSATFPTIRSSGGRFQGIGFVNRSQGDDSFCTKAVSTEEVARLIIERSDVAQYFFAPHQWRAGTLRWSAWAIVVSERGVYVQGSPGPIHRAPLRADLGPRKPSTATSS